MQEHFPPATVGSQNPGEGSREKNFKVAATEGGVRFFLKGNYEAECTFSWLAAMMMAEAARCCEISEPKADGP